METNRKLRITALVVLALFAAAVLVAYRFPGQLPGPLPSLLPGLRPSPPPDFAAITVVTQRKGVFFDYLKPLVSAENSAILKERQSLLGMAQHSTELSWRELNALATLAQKYELAVEGMPAAEMINQLLARVDMVPESLVLAQAAKESGWGTSRFATAGNNFFGQRCYVAGCGIVPNGRGAGERYEVANFDSPQQSIASYLRNLNSHSQYESLRVYRARIRASGNMVTGARLAEQLTQYSERREEYVEEIQSLIHYNKLDNTF